MTDYFAETMLRVRQAMEETGLSEADIATMDLDAFARLTGRPTPAEAARAAITAQYEQEQPPAPDVPQAAPQAPEGEPQGVDIANMTMEEYAAVRGQLGMGQHHQEGVGILDVAGSQTWAEAARRQPGRSGWLRRNVVESPRLTGRYLDHDAQRDTRTAAERFHTPGNEFSL